MNFGNNIHGNEALGETQLKSETKSYKEAGELVNLWRRIDSTRAHVVCVVPTLCDPTWTWNGVLGRLARMGPGMAQQLYDLVASSLDMG